MLRIWPLLPVISGVVQSSVCNLHDLVLAFLCLYRNPSTYSSLPYLLVLEASLYTWQLSIQDQKGIKGSFKQWQPPSWDAEIPKAKLPELWYPWTQEKWVGCYSPFLPPWSLGWVSLANTPVLSTPAQFHGLKHCSFSLEGFWDQAAQIHQMGSVENRTPAWDKWQKTDAGLLICPLFKEKA